MAASMEKHAFVILVGPSHAEMAAAEQELLLAALGRSFEEASFEIVVIEADLVDGNYMLVPHRGSVGGMGSVLRPQPPAALYHAIDAKLEELRFLQPPTVH